MFRNHQEFGVMYGLVDSERLNNILAVRRNRAIIHTGLLVPRCSHRL